MIANREPQIELEELIKDLQVKDDATFHDYLAEIWKDLASRSDKVKGLDKVTFNHYYDLPGIINDRLFSCFNQSDSKQLSSDEFINGMMTLYTGQYQQLSKFIFKFYDFNKDGYIDKEDIKSVLIYVPLQKKILKDKMKYEQASYQDRVESQLEIEEMLDRAFGKKEKLSEAEFNSVIENISSDIFIYILTFLLEKKPFAHESLAIYPKSKSPSLNAKAKNKKIASPTLKSKFISPTLKRRTIDLENEAKSVLNLYTVNKHKPVIQLNFLPTKAPEGKKPSDKNTKKDSDKEAKKSTKIPTLSRAPKRHNNQNLKNIDDVKKDNSNFKIGLSSANEIKLDEDDTDLELPTPPVVKHEGYMYKLSEEKLKKVYFRLVGKDFFYYKSKDDLEHKGIHNLSGVYILNESKTKIGDKEYYSFSIKYPKKKRTYYIDNEEDFNEWLDKLKQSVDYKNIFDEYTFKTKAGKGKFGLVRLGTHKASGKSVAIKIMDKRHMNAQDLELAKTEIDILKVCQHQNIIKLYDVYEIENNIYIIMEYCAGGDLFTYIEKRGFKLPERRAAEIIHKLSMAVYYIHSYNIVHRDLKPENILMTSDDENADIRVLDFGLSKIIGPTITCTEPYGTLSYVAPEVLKEMPYGKEVDLWSIGIITFLLLVGYLPFDDEISEREIARQTIEDDVPFNKTIWKSMPEAKDFIDNLLQKDPKKRMSIEKVLEHNWFKKFIKLSPERLSPRKNKRTSFSLYSSNISE